MTIADFIKTYRHYGNITDAQLSEGMFYTRSAFDQLKTSFRRTFIQIMTTTQKVISVETSIPLNNRSPYWGKTLLCILAQILLFQIKITGNPSPFAELVRSEKGWIMNITTLQISPSDLN